jgi:hypothetical protein
MNEKGIRGIRGDVGIAHGAILIPQSPAIPASPFLGFADTLTRIHRFADVDARDEPEHDAWWEKQEGRS